MTRWVNENTGEEIDMIELDAIKSGDRKSEEARSNRNNVTDRSGSETGAAGQWTKSDGGTDMTNIIRFRTLICRTTTIRCATLKRPVQQHLPNWSGWSGQRTALTIVRAESAAKAIGRP
jgi:hypothetical protein